MCEVAHVAVVKAARGLDFVFGVGELALQLQKVLVGFEVGVRLGDGKKRFERAANMIFGRAFLLQAPPAPIAAVRASVTFSNTPFSCAA